MGGPVGTPGPQPQPGTQIRQGLEWSQCLDLRRMHIAPLAARQTGNVGMTGAGDAEPHVRAQGSRCAEPFEKHVSVFQGRHRKAHVVRGQRVSVARKQQRSAPKGCTRNKVNLGCTGSGGELDCAPVPPTSPHSCAAKTRSSTAAQTPGSASDSDSVHPGTSKPPSRDATDAGLRLVPADVTGGGPTDPPLASSKRTSLGSANRPHEN